MPASNDREKHRIAGNQERTRNAWTSQRARLVHPFHRPCVMMSDCLQVCLLFSYADRTRATRTSSRHPLPCFSRLVRRSLFFRPCHCTVRRFALVKAHVVLRVPASVMRQRRKLSLPNELVSLDNSCPPNSGYLGAEKKQFWAQWAYCPPQAIMLECAKARKDNQNENSHLCPCKF